jgi:type I restriction enzyme S subunit
VAAYGALGEAVFLEMFGDPVRNEKGWTKDIIKNIGRVTTGNTPSRADSDNFGDAIEWIKTGNINVPAVYLTESEEGLSDSGKLKARIVQRGAILVTCIAGSKSVIGNASVVDREVAFNQQINAFHDFSGEPLFFYYQFLLSKSYVQSFSTDGMKGIITKGRFEQIEFILPPLPLQHQFAARIREIEGLKAKAELALLEADGLFGGVMGEVFG